MLPEVEGFEIEGLVGRGAFSTVYRATEPGLGRTVAVKIIDIDPGDLERQRRFERECILIGRLAVHPNVVSVFSQGVTGEGLPYLVMELCPAGSLRVAVTANGLFAPTDVLAIGVALAGALETAHLEGVLHRDLKPENILVGADGSPKVGDFGIATLAAGATATTTSAMTPVHAAPELFDGRPASIRSDVYSLGSTLFTLLEGRPPITLELGELAAFVTRAATEVRPPVGVRVPSQFAALIAELLSLDPHDRPGTMAEIGERMRSIQAALGEPRTPMVVIQPSSETVDVGPEPGPASTTEPPGSSRFLSAMPTAGTAAAPPGVPAEPSRSRRGIVVAVVLAGALIAAAFAVGTRFGHDAGDRGAAASTTTSAPAGLPGLDGVQVDWTSPRADGDVSDEVLVVHDPSLEDVDSAALQIMKDLRAALDPKTAATPQEQLAELPQTPAEAPYDYPVRIVMDYLNPIGYGTGKCRGFKSSLIGMIDSRYMVYNSDSVLMTTQFDTPESAREGFVGMAVQLGLTPDQCTGFDDDGWPADRSVMDVARNDYALETPEGLDDFLTGMTPDFAHAFIARRGTEVTFVRTASAEHPDGVATLTPFVTAVATTMRENVVR